LAVANLDDVYPAPRIAVTGLATAVGIAPAREAVTPLDCWFKNYLSSINILYKINM
jgi:hypothetical protein